MKTLSHPNTFTTPTGSSLESRFSRQEEKFQFNYPEGVDYRFRRPQLKSYRTGRTEEPPAKQQSFVEEKEVLDTFAGDLLNKQQSFDELIESLADCEFNLDLISDSYKEEIKALTDRANADLELVRQEVRIAKEMANHIANQFKSQIRESNWQKSNKANEK